MKIVVLTVGTFSKLSLVGFSEHLGTTLIWTISEQPRLFLNFLCPTMATCPFPLLLYIFYELSLRTTEKKKNEKNLKQEQLLAL